MNAIQAYQALRNPHPATLRHYAAAAIEEIGGNPRQLAELYRLRDGKYFPFEIIEQIFGAEIYRSFWQEEYRLAEASATPCSLRGSGIVDRPIHQPGNNPWVWRYNDASLVCSECGASYVAIGSKKFRHP